MRRALTIGLNSYPERPLRSAATDADRLTELLERNADRSMNFSCIRGHRSMETMRSGIKTTDGHLSAAQFLHLTDLLLRKDAEVALLYFAGHAELGEDRAGYLLCNDGPTPERVPMSAIMEQIMASPVEQVIVMLDCCFSGGFGDFANGGVRLRSGVAILTATGADEAAAEYSSGGLFTSLVCAALEGGAADVLGNVSIASIYSFLDETLGPWDQRPRLSASVSKLVSLRSCEPAVSHDVLDAAMRLFESPDAVYKLDPTYEKDPVYGKPGFPEHIAIMEKFQVCRAAHLVEPIGYPHMFEAAINWTGCQLTPLGRRYWKRIADGLL